ncbi:OPT/YSL family transporter, partial [Kaarinaea lacus]
AEALSNGVGAIPASALWAIAIGGAVGIAGALLQHYRSPRWLPNLPAFGLAMVIPVSISITMFFGSLVGKLLERYQPSLAQRFLIASASGLIAGESLTGVMRALLGIMS